MVTSKRRAKMMARETGQRVMVLMRMQATMSTDAINSYLSKYSFWGLRKAPRRVYLRRRDLARMESGVRSDLMSGEASAFLKLRGVNLVGVWGCDLQRSLRR